MKYQIVCPVNIEWKTFEIYLRTLSYHFRTIGNRTIQKLWEYDNQSLKHFKDTGQYPSAQQLYGCTQKTISGYIYDQLKKNIKILIKPICPLLYRKQLGPGIVEKRNLEW